jgi:oligoendopeptidase F
MVLSRWALPVFLLGEDADSTPLWKERDRSRIPERYTWKTADLYASPGDWRLAQQALKDAIPAIEKCRGTLARSASTLLACLDTVSAVSKEYSRLSVYAGLTSDIDTRDGTALAMVQEMTHIGSDIGAKTSFLQPEILAMGAETVERFLSEEPRLGVYRHDLHDILRRKDHTGTEGEEKIIADAGLMADGPDNIYTVFSNAEFPFPEVNLRDGSTVRLDKAAFALHRSAPDREDRKAVFAGYFGRLNDFRRTFGAQLYAQVKKDLFSMRARRYGSGLEAALDGGNIPAEVYHNLIKGVHTHLKTFHRYLEIRRRLLGVDRLHYYDLYAPVVPDLERTYSYDEAQTMVLDAFAPLGEEYVRTARRSFEERWLDVFPTEGKRSGAYSNGAAYDVHPYMLLNYNGKYDDVSTLAHELGHTMHSHLSNSRQPYPTAQYSIFVAEVASTFNESLLLDAVLRTVHDDRTRLILLVEYLDGVRGTVFRQTQFAEFELRIHEMAERGHTLTGDGLNNLYTEITRRYYGHDRGVCTVDDEIGSEWAHVPHFYYTFYVFQYATSFTASTALVDRVLAGEPGARELYLELLSAGGSDYPMALLKRAGVDMATPVPFERMIRRVDRVLDEVEEIIGSGDQ